MRIGSIARWQKARLGDHVDIQTGFPFKSKEYTDDPSGTSLLRGDNIVQGKLRWDGVKRWSDNNADAYEKYSLREGDVVLAMDRPWIEAGLKYAWITKRDLPCLLVQRVARLRGVNGLSTDYIRYIIGHHSFTDYVKGIWTGVAVPHISESQIRAFPILLPPPDVQEKITAVLSAYDDLIENNSRRIEILEQMAQMVYREWFVYFRFPGHEAIEMVASALGPIPNGWVVEKVGDRYTTVLGGTPSRNKPEFWESGTIPWINSGEVNKLRVIEPSEFITSEALSKSSAKLMPKKATVVAITGATLGQVSLLEIESSANQSVVGIYDREGNFSQYLYLTFTAIIGAVIKHASGGAQQHINKEIVNDTKIVVPPMVVMKRFNEIVVPIFDLIASLFFKNATLRKTRDLLLPKLISGQISVDQLDLSVSQNA